jgi:tRNA threonylcarbamoyladenosine biosynthesis protein TsaB
LLCLAGIDAGDLAAVAVASGPGTFSGLRVGMSIAKGFVLARPDIRLIGVSTMDVTAYPWSGLWERIVAIVPAGRERMVWRQLNAGVAQPMVNGLASELAQELAGEAEPWLVAGELSEAQRAELAGVAAVRLPPRTAGLRRPGCLAELGWQRFAAGEWDDPATLEPLYLHGSRRR